MKQMYEALFDFPLQPSKKCSLKPRILWAQHIVYGAPPIGPIRHSPEAAQQLPLLHFSPTFGLWHEDQPALQGRMAKLSLPSSRSRLCALQPRAARGFASLPRRQLAHPRPGILKEPFLPPLSANPLPVTYFSPTEVHREVVGLGGSPQKNDHKPPDERDLKLGKSKRISLSGIAKL